MILQLSTFDKKHFRGGWEDGFMIQPFEFMFQEEAKDFLTMDNLDERIEEALDNPKNYNFAIDKEGRVVKRTAIQ